MYCFIKLKTNQFVLFDSDTVQPSLFALRYSMERLFFRSANYQLNCLKSIRHFYNFWIEKFDETLDCSLYKSELRGIDTLINEIDAFYYYIVNGYTLTPSINNKDFRTQNNNTAVNHVKAAGRFIEFLINTYISSVYVEDDIKSIHSLQERFSRSLAAKTSIYRVHSKTSSFKSLTEQQFYQFFTIVKPNKNNQPNILNPFVSLDTQHRNYLLVVLLSYLGIRVGEALLIRKSSFISNLHRTKFYLRIDCLEDDSDKRIHRPSIKTAASIRTLEVSKKLFNSILHYYEHSRPDTAVDNNYLFVSLKEPYPPLSYRAVWEIFSAYNSVLKKENPEFYDKTHSESIESVSPHTMRHTWAYGMLNNIYDSLISSNNLASHMSINNSLMEQAKDKLRVLGGWSPTSQIPGHYAARFIAESANKELGKYWNSFQSVVDL